MNLRTVKAVCEGVQTSHGKIEILSHSVKTLGYLLRDGIQPGMTPTDWSQAQSKDPILSKILEVIHNKTITNVN